MAGTSLASLIFQDVVWRLVSRDDETEIIGQYIPKDLQETIKGRWVQTRTLGRNQPILQFEDEESDVFTFTARVFAQHEGFFGLTRPDSIEDIVAQIRALPKADPRFGRPLIWDFAVGEVIRMTCVVESVGPVRYDRLRPAFGDFRGATFSLTLRRYVGYDTTLTEFQLPESLILPALERDSYEFLAQRAYGKPELGDAIRRRNPELRVPTLGELIHLPPETSLRENFVLTPQSPVLARTAENDERRREHVKLRGRSKLSYTLGPEWDKAV